MLRNALIIHFLHIKLSIKHSTTASDGRNVVFNMKALARALILIFFFLFGLTVRAQVHLETQIVKIPLSQQQVESLPAYVREALETAAYELTSIWADTILEGDYYADEKVEIELIEKLYLSQAFMGYRITYSSKAWNTMNCHFDASALSSLEDCEEGRIVESGFVSLDFSELSRDPAAFATFKR